MRRQPFLIVLAILILTVALSVLVSRPAHGDNECPLPGRVVAPEGALVVDHRSIALFDQIPESCIQAASQIRLLFRHASVGGNISRGLDCLMNNFARRPYHCDRDIPADQVIYDSRYDRRNWSFEFHARPNPNPGWWNKVNYFISRVDGLGQNEPYQVVSFKFGYVDGFEGSNIDEKFFRNDPNDNLPSVEEVLALEARHPNRHFMWWTMGLARLGAPDTQNFNRQMRSYAAAHNKVLLDLAAIESHRPDGSPCYDNRNRGIEAICADYTNERNGGHLNALGKQRMAKAFWVMMARLAGWNPATQ